MIDIVELAVAYWHKSKKDFKKSRNKLITLAAFLIVTYGTLEFGSYIFSWHLNQAKAVEAIRAKFIDKRVAFAENYQHHVYRLKEKTRILILEINRKRYTPLQCEKLKKELKIDELESEFFVNASYIRFYFGEDITNDFLNLIHWYDKYSEKCFHEIPDAEEFMDKKVILIQRKMWDKMYPSEALKGIHE